MRNSVFEARLNSFGVRLCRQATRWMLLTILLGYSATALAGGPRWVAGKSYFDPAAKGRPLHWKNGSLPYYLDQGPLSSDVDHAAAEALVNQAAAQWNSVVTAAVSITEAGSLDEDVSSANVSSTPGPVPSGWTQAPADILPTALDKPLAVILDVDGTVLDALLGPGASDPLACTMNSVTVQVDAIATDGTFQHAFLLLNGRCAHTAAQMETMPQAVVRGFGRVLGLDWSQANDDVPYGNPTNFSASLAGWPLMHPIEPPCDPMQVPCVFRGMALRPDDIAAISRIYPVTPDNLSNYLSSNPAKQLTAATTVSIQGTIRFPTGQGMQGVNVVAYPLNPDTHLPDTRYPVSAVTGEYFQGNQGNPVTGWVDLQGNRFDRFGSDDAALEGFFDLSAMPLPPGQSQADYLLTFEPINALYERATSVGAQTLGAPLPAGTMPAVLIRSLGAGATRQQDILIPDAPQESHSGKDGSETAPAVLPGSGEWVGRLTGYGHSGWFGLAVKGNRYFTVEAQALNERGQSSQQKARLVLGVWNAIDSPGSPSVVNSVQALGGYSGVSYVGVTTMGDGDLRLGIADERGDGRPDYLYRGRVLYADTVTPGRISRSGGSITIRGLGFREGNIVRIAGVPATITSVSPTELTAIAPPAAAGVSGTVLVEVYDPATAGFARIGDGLSYDASGSDALNLVTAPMYTVPLDVPLPFVVRAMDTNMNPVPGLTVTYAMAFGQATLGCGQPVCTVIAGGDGLVRLDITATSTSASSVTASLSNGASVRIEFTGGVPPSVAALDSQLYLARGATFVWQPRALVLNAGVPMAGQAVSWSSGAGATAQTSSSVTGSNGMTSAHVTAGPLGTATNVQIQACINGGASCGSFTVSSVYPEYAGLLAVSGAGQTMRVEDTPAPIVLRAVDAAGHPMAGAVVSLYQTLSRWSPACGPHDRCRMAPVLNRQMTSAVSGGDGLVTFTPLSQDGVATRLRVTAVTGLLAEINFEIERHP
ncbi:MAG TPA: IPT/TIG domain-containing protein [Acidisarcina sp.]|nr:IPT/TIG domain-containing protein [Acidisarcina sp.]